MGRPGRPEARTRVPPRPLTEIPDRQHAVTGVTRKASKRSAGDSRGSATSAKAQGDNKVVLEHRFFSTRRSRSIRFRNGVTDGDRRSRTVIDCRRSPTSRSVGQFAAEVRESPATPGAPTRARGFAISGRVRPSARSGKAIGAASAGITSHGTRSHESKLKTKRASLRRKRHHIRQEASRGTAECPRLSVWPFTRACATSTRRSSTISRARRWPRRTHSSRASRPISRGDLQQGGRQSGRASGRRACDRQGRQAGRLRTAVVTCTTARSRRWPMPRERRVSISKREQGKAESVSNNRRRGGGRRDVQLDRDFFEQGSPHHTPCDQGRQGW